MLWSLYNSQSTSKSVLFEGRRCCISYTEKEESRNGAPLWHLSSLKTCTHKNQQGSIFAQMLSLNMVSSQVVRYRRHFATLVALGLNFGLKPTWLRDVKLRSPGWKWCVCVAHFSTQTTPLSLFDFLCILYQVEQLLWLSHTEAEAFILELV